MPVEAPVSQIPQKEENLPHQESSITPVVGQEKSFANTVAFLEKVKNTPASQQKPTIISDEGWARNLRILYTWASGTSIYRIAEDENMTPQNINLIKNRTLRRLCEKSPKEIQQEYPLETLALKIPKKKEALEEALAKDTTTAKVIRLKLQNKTIKEIASELRQQGVIIDPYQIRDILIHHGFKINPSIFSYVPRERLVNRLTTAKTYAEKKRHLKKVRRAFYQQYVKGENPLLTNMRSAVAEAGFPLTGIGKFADALGKANSPVAFGKLESIVHKGSPKQVRLRYFFILTADKRKAIEIWLANPPDLKRHLTLQQAA